MILGFSVEVYIKGLKLHAVIIYLLIFHFFSALLAAFKTLQSKSFLLFQLLGFIQSRTGNVLLSIQFKLLIKSLSRSA
jgi:hypothetical protein